jgi:hypothetical protein
MKAPQLAWAWGGLDDRKTAGDVDLICTARRRLAQPPALVDYRRHLQSARQVEREVAGQLRETIQVEVKPSGTPGKLGRLIRGVQSERPRKRRQSGVVECRRQPAPEGALATLARTGDVTNI